MVEERRPIWHRRQSHEPARQQPERPGGGRGIKNERMIWGKKKKRNEGHMEHTTLRRNAGGKQEKAANGKEVTETTPTWHGQPAPPPNGTQTGEKITRTGVLKKPENGGKTKGAVITHPDTTGIGKDTRRGGDRLNGGRNDEKEMNLLAAKEKAKEEENKETRSEEQEGVGGKKWERRNPKEEQREARGRKKRSKER